MDRTDALQALDVLVGEWALDVVFPQGPHPAAKEVRATSRFEWILDGAFLLQRTDVPLPEAPDGHMVIALDHDGAGFTQHYFDSRGVVRLYAMTLAHGVWTLERTAPDFSPLDFCQRYVGEIADDGSAITGRWDSAPVGTEDWELDFHLSYHRLT
jgi:hypothetical protein